MRLAWLVVVLSMWAAACSSGHGPPDGTSSTGYDYAHSPGAALYQQMCQVCHGETGEGGLGPALRDSPRSLDDLTAIIAARMPQNAPGQCTGDCAAQTAEFIAHGLATPALACDAVTPAPRRLRLLTRREYRATVRDLFGAGAPAMTCPHITDCAFRDSCEAGQCEASPCDTQTFIYDPKGAPHTTVHVAGDFNNWPQTIAGGGLPLAYSAATGLWTGTFAIGQGNHVYKLVLDQQTWIADPRAPSTVSDGFGGQNAVLVLACTGAAVLDDPAGAVPVEARPAGFPFDTDADVALVTDAHVDAYVTAAEQIASYVAGDPAQLGACDWAAARPTCAASLVGSLGKRVFRRPLTSDEATRYAAMITSATDATSGVTAAVMAMLVSPSFLYRSELGVADGANFRLTPYELATALAYTFWGSTPDDTLLAAADAGQLGDATGLEAAARRLVADPRARAQIGEFALQWVGGQAVLDADKRVDLFPDFDAARIALAAETRNFAADVVFDGSGAYEDLLTANYTVLDERAAAFYGVPAPAGATGHVSYGDGRRAGVLGHASVLATTAHSDETSPVERGLLIRRNLLCQELPPPPPFAGQLPPVDPNATTQQRFEMHSANAACAGCHVYIDDVGFGLERFDPVGRWRDAENGLAIDPAGDMNDVEQLGTGTSAPYMSLPELAATIAGSQNGPACFARQWLRFSRGLHETLAERCGRLWIQSKFDAANHDVRELMVQSVLSPDFAERRP